MTTPEKIKKLINQINSECIYTTATSTHFDGDIAFKLIQSFAVDIALATSKQYESAVVETAKINTYERDPEPNPTRKPGRPKAE